MKFLGQFQVNTILGLLLEPLFPKCAIVTNLHNNKAHLPNLNPKIPSQLLEPSFLEAHLIHFLFS